MNAIKNILVIAVLLGVGYAVYTTLNSQPGSPAPDQADRWPTSVDIQMPEDAGVKTNRTSPPLSARSGGPSEAPPAGGAPRWNSPSPDPSPSTSSRPLKGGNDVGWPPTRENKTDFPPGEALTSDLGSAGSSRTMPSQAVRRNSPPSPQPTGTRPEFIAMMEDAERRLAKGESEFAQVHLELSRLYGDPILTAEESRQLTELLDQLAGTVIYSRRHLLEPPYLVKPGDTLQSIAQGYNVPWQLLAKINGIRDPEQLEPGSQLKVVRGPFEVLVSLERFELTLVVGGRYAGRFPIGIGRDAPPQLEGSYTVQRKVTPNRFSPPGGQNVPQGQFLIELADRLVIHGTDDLRNLRRADGPGVICLGPRDIEDLCDILTAKSEAALASTVAIRR